MSLKLKRLLAALLVIMVLSAAALSEAPEAAEPAAAEAPEAAEPAAEEASEPTEPAAAEEASEAAEPTAAPARGYVLVTTATRSGWLPLPEEGEVSYPLQQILPDGTEAVNVIHLTPDGVYMEDSTCANHDCIKQGEVTLENLDERILGNRIICLPNQVSLQLFTPEELLSMVKGSEAP